MPSNTTRHRPWIVVALVAALVVVPTAAMGVGILGMGPAMGGHWGHGMWGASDGPSAWMLALGAGVQLLFLTLLLGLGYLGYRALTAQAGPNDSAIEELRIAYARGDIDDEEFDRRRKRLEQPQ
jgi:putative membrane protein